MIPSSVKNERSLWLHAVWSAWKMASERGMGYKLRRQQAAMGGNTCRPFCRPLPLSAALFVPQRLDRIEPRSAADRKSTRLNSSHSQISYAVFCLKKKKKQSQLILTQHEIRPQITTASHLH